MTQIVLNIENQAIVPHLKKILSAIEGVSIAKENKGRKASVDIALDDVKAGRINKYASAQDLFDAFGI